MRDLLYLHVHTPPKIKDGEKWFEQDEGDARLSRDRQLIKGKYPDLKYGLNHRNKFVFLYGEIVLKEASSGIPTRIGVKILFPDEYPKTEPIAVEIANLFEHIADRHFYPNGICCLWLPPESQWNPDDENALLKFLDHVAVFFERQLIYDATGGTVWAWGERGHGRSGYIEYIQEKLNVTSEKLQNFLPLISGKMSFEKKSRCPCGSGRPFRFCHLSMVVELTAVANFIN